MADNQMRRQLRTYICLSISCLSLLSTIDSWRFPRCCMVYFSGAFSPHTLLTTPHNQFHHSPLSLPHLLLDKFGSLTQP